MANENQEQTHLTISELASRWRVSHSYIRSKMREGKLAVTRFGRAVRIPVEEANRFVLQRTIEVQKLLNKDDKRKANK